jgi:hypothetical protein
MPVEGGSEPVSAAVKVLEGASVLACAGMTYIL